MVCSSYSTYAPDSIDLPFGVTLKFCFDCLEKWSVSKNVKSTSFPLVFVVRPDCLTFDGSLKLITY